MVHKVPENFNISDFDVFHSALIYIYIYTIMLRFVLKVQQYGCLYLFAM